MKKAQPKKTPAEMKALLKQRKEIHIDSETAPTFYANNASVSISPWDVRIRLAQVEEASLEKLVLHDLCTVFMSPQHAKAFSKLLSDKVEQHEKMLAEHTKQLAELAAVDEPPEDE